MYKSECISTKKQLKEIIEYECARYGDTNNIRKMFPLSEKDILIRHQILLRKAEYHTNVNNRLRSILYRFLLLRIQNKYAIHIPLNVCDRGLKIMHVGPILINGGAHVGKDCVFHINTSLVASGLSDEAPSLGNGCIVGVGAVVLGNVIIADNVVIGANAVVNKSVTNNNVTVAGIPAKIVSQNGSIQWRRSDKV